METIGIFYYHLEYLTAIWYNMWPFGIVCGRLVYIFSILVCLVQKKSGNPVRVALAFSGLTFAGQGRAWRNCWVM
jgi:hypothetical protein